MAEDDPRPWLSGLAGWGAVVRFLWLSDIGALADFVLMHAVTAGTAVAFAAAAE